MIRENLIIKGNNLLALHSLKTEFRDKVKLIYIDPPYNREADVFYNDNFKRSAWLSFMKNRLDIAKDLLAKDGAIFIQIDDAQMAYLKLLCDEVFSEDNFSTIICVKMSHLSGVKMAHKEIKLPKIKEYILMYTKASAVRLNPQYEAVSWDEALERYTSFVIKHNHNDENCHKWEVLPLSQAIKKAGVDLNDNKAVMAFKLKNAHLIFRTARNRSADYSHLPKDKFNRVINPDGSYYFVYKHEDVNFASEKVIEIEGKPTPVNTIGDIWLDIGINNLSNEGGVDLRFGKKPEKLIHRIIDMVAADKSDIIMDFFTGSGTTVAVAHKMGRQYIGIEQLDYGENDSVHRLQNVIGKRKKKLFDEYEDYDTLAISKTVSWKGGGDFIYCELMRYNEAFMDKIQEVRTSKELVKLWKDIAENSFLNWHVNPQTPEDAIKDFEEIGKGEDGLKKQKKLLAELLNKNQLYVNLSEIDDKQFNVSDEDKKLNSEFYGEAFNG
ncbi:MAG: site-specific DNA-methyltransferase [Nitrospiraceae bacterium]|nr:site-specific DNA-methyltransferase [Nitrospiraceae bacterium]